MEFSTATGSCVDLYREKAHEIVKQQDLNAVDIIVLLVYFALVLIVGFAVSVTDITIL